MGTARCDGRCRQVSIGAVRRQYVVSRGGASAEAAQTRTLADVMLHLAWHRLLQAGRYGSIKALARAECVHHAYVAKLLRLTLLAPDVVEAVLDGRLPKGVKLEEGYGQVWCMEAQAAAWPSVPGT